MPNFAENPWSSTRDSSLYCVWVPERDDGGCRLVAIWIDRALTAFESCAPESDDVEGTDKVEVQAILTSTGRQNLLLEQTVSRLNLEPGVSGVSWEIADEHD